ncbi:hypothetical protein [Hymenobacter crusticola]|uniref:Uncharacterized protein n=1 Tax=Hymenobacter crusticola TaxID=1770526 RepID=A0A243W5S7_9BACT|nr:hypothetical protein [Hymenobacter crusticola]OUJ68824.1 hypothetical protein BXP70_27390 [Hymenobacter crusticola]
MKSTILIVGALSACHMALARQAGAEVISYDEARERGIVGETEPKQVLPLTMPVKPVYDEVDLNNLGFGRHYTSRKQQFRGYTSSRRRYK